MTTPCPCPVDFGLPSTFPSFRERQLEIATDAACATHSGQRFYVLNLQVGGGKSLTCQTFAKLKGGRTLTLAPLKSLQSQIEGDFPNIVNIYGHSHYDCSSSSVTDGEMDFECAGPCGYKPRVAAARESSNVLTNPAHWCNILKSDSPHRLGVFDNLVIDEAHRIHDMLCDYMAFVISYRRVFNLIHLEPLKLTSPITEWFEWAKVAITKCHDRIDQLNKLAGAASDHSKLIRRLTYLLNDLSRFVDTHTETPWVAAPVPHESQQVKLTPVWGKKFAERYLFANIPNVFMCSGTIQEQSIADLGIQPGQYTYRDEESLFPPERSPIIYIPTVAVNSRMMDSERSALVHRIDQIISQSLKYKGTIQVTGYEWARQIAYRSQYGPNSAVPAMLCGVDRDSARESFERFNSPASNPPDVLLSPIIKEGLDLHGDKCRYQIIPKIPFPDTRDPLTAARSKDDKGYMSRIAALTLEQMKGRSTRSKTDWSVVWMLDDTWVAPWFRKAPFSRSFKRCMRKAESVGEAVVGVYGRLDK